jgi:short-subunit dehydrogenase
MGDTVIVITGASEGIGYECAKALLDRTNASVLVTGRCAEKLQRAREALPTPQRDRLRTHVCDQGDARAVDALLTLLATTDEPLDGAILTVGVNPLYREGPRRLHALDAGTIDDTIRINCTHTLRITSALLERFRRQRAGVLIWIGSQAARFGMPGAALYGATKAFLSGVAVAAHREYAERGVRVHLLHPGVVRTPRTLAVADQFAARHGLAVAEACDVAGQVVDVFLTGDPAAVETDL